MPSLLLLKKLIHLFVIATFFTGQLSPLKMTIQLDRSSSSEILLIWIRFPVLKITMLFFIPILGKLLLSATTKFPVNVSKIFISKLEISTPESKESKTSTSLRVRSFRSSSTKLAFSGHWAMVCKEKVIIHIKDNITFEMNPCITS